MEAKIMVSFRRFRLILEIKLLIIGKRSVQESGFKSIKLQEFTYWLELSFVYG